MRNSVGTAVVPLKAPRGSFRGGPRGSDKDSVPAGVTPSVSDSLFGDRFSNLMFNHDLFTYKLSLGYSLLYVDIAVHVQCIQSSALAALVSYSSKHFYDNNTLQCIFT